MTGTTFTRSIPLTHKANLSKVGSLREYVQRFRSALAMCKQDKIKDLRSGGKIRRWSKNEWSLYKPDWMTARQFKSVENMVNAALKSWQSRSVVEGRKIISSWLDSGVITKDESLVLYKKNKSKNWWSSPKSYLSDRLISDILKTNPFPVFTSLSVTLDSISCKIVSSEKTNHHHWLQVHVIDNEVIDIPVIIDDYYRRRMNEGRECSVTQLSFDKEGNLRIHRMVQIDAAPLRQSGSQVGVDWGLSVLASTSDGELLGRKLYPWLKDRDRELTELTRSLQRQGIKPRQSKRYRRLTHRISEYVKNEVCRVLNGLSNRDIKSIVVEDLNFRLGGLSRTLNRIVSRSGRKVWKNKLRDLTDRKGISIAYVSPSYTSQTCSGCGLVCKNNRRNRDTYVCRFCGKRIHADVNASRNLVRRSFEVNGLVFHSKKSILSHLDREFMNRWKCDPGRLVKREHARAAGLSGNLEIHPGLD